ncbi:MAG: hypothetical protein EOO11_08575 [Chitinophagaceae bacterium]|nr:MAG: hypothetical protein EOO11_08575 [Chitinophagaceae bacterium]
MQPLKTLRLLGTFYGSFVPASLVVTGCCLALFWQHGFAIFRALFWLKLGTLAITWHFINQRKAKEYFYYGNLGLSKVLLWGATLSFDFALFVLSIILTHQLK